MPRKRKCDVTGVSGAEPMTVKWRDEEWEVWVTPEVAEPTMRMARHGTSLVSEKRGLEALVEKFDPKR